jgi:hypothetical protein
MTVAIILLALAILPALYIAPTPELGVAEPQRRWGSDPSDFLDILGMRVHVRDEGPSQGAFYRGPTRSPPPTIGARG